MTCAYAYRPAYNTEKYQLSPYSGMCNQLDVKRHKVECMIKEYNIHRPHPG